MSTDVSTMSSNFQSGADILVFKEDGKEETCIKSLANNKDGVWVDTHEYSYLVVGKKGMDIAITGCSNIPLIKAKELDENGLHVPVFVSRTQEFKRFDIIWTYKAKMISEGMEDFGNSEGVSYITFFDVKDMSTLTLDPVKFEE